MNGSGVARERCGSVGGAPGSYVMAMVLMVLIGPVVLLKICVQR